VRVSDLIERLTELRDIHGEQQVFLDVSQDGLIEIGEVDVDADDTGIIIWKADED
jgi:hypothetical protein